MTPLFLYLLYLLVFLPVPYKIGDRAVVSALAGLREKASGHFVIAAVIFYAVAACAFTRAGLIGAGALSQRSLFFTFHDNLRKFKKWRV